MQSSGALVTCQSEQSLAEGRAEAIATSAAVFSSAAGNGKAMAVANAGFDYFVVVGNLPGNTLVGHCTYFANCPTCRDPFSAVPISIQQGTVSVKNPRTGSR